MRNCVVTGCGRNGTSMVAGLLATAGYDLGRRIADADASNPKGNYEDLDVNALNEDLLTPATDALGSGGGLYARPLRRGERWLAALPVGTAPEVSQEQRARMQALRPDGAAGWCRKDPRFAYTLPVWAPVIGDAVRIAVFREPARVAHSIVAHAANGTLGLGFDAALAIWTAVNRAVLAQADADPGWWIFVHYDQVLDGAALDRLEAALEASLASAHSAWVDSALRRSPGQGAVPAATTQVYAELCARARVAAPA